MKGMRVFCVLAGGVVASVINPAFALELDYVHKYEDVSKEHTDEFEITHDFDSGIGIGAKFKFHPREQDNGDSGKAFDRTKLNEKEFKVNYNWSFAERWKLEPGMVWAIKEEEQKYKPSLKLKYQLFEHTRLSVRYRNEITDRDNKSTKRVHRIDSEISQKIGAFELAYTWTYYHGNMNLYDNRRADYEHEVEISYELTKHLTPYIEVKNESVDDDSSQRQTEFGVGINYQF